MPQLFRPPRPFPAPLEPSPPLDPAASMPPPPPAPPLAAEDEMGLHLPYTMSREDRAWGMAMIGLHIVICIDMLFSIWPFDSDSIPDEARFWIWLYLCFAALMAIAFVYDQPLQKLEAAAAMQLPPPPPEMDMC